MKTTLSFLIVCAFLSLFNLTSCRNLKADPLRDKIKIEAEVMCNALVNKNYVDFIKYMYPPLVEMMGGKEKVLNAFSQGLPDSIIIMSVKLSYPSDTIMVNNQIQCTLKEVIEMKVKGGKLITTSTLIGLSANHGITWYFLDANSKSLETLKSNFPNLSERLIFEGSSKPTYIKE